MKRNTKNQKIVDKMIETLEGKGFVMDRYGNAKKTVNGQLYRYKFNATSYRQEVKVGDSWMKVNGSYYKNVKI